MKNSKMEADLLKAQCVEGSVYGRTGGDKFAICIPKEEFKEQDFMDAIQTMGHAFNNDLYHLHIYEDDRAVLRALHFFGETSRVEDAADAIHHNDYDKFLELIDESGKSSWELLQNCYTMKDFHEQKITRTLALTQLFLKKIGAGVCRVHGGGFAGVIAAIVPEKEQDNYVEYISRFVGKENVYPMDIRAIGAVHIG